MAVLRTTVKFLFELEKLDGLLRGTAKLLPPLPEPEVKRERLVEVLGAARASRSKHVNRAFLSGLLVVLSNEEPWERICGGQGAEGAKPGGVPNAGPGHDDII